MNQQILSGFLGALKLQRITRRTHKLTPGYEVTLQDLQRPLNHFGAKIALIEALKEFTKEN